MPITNKQITDFFGLVGKTIPPNKFGKFTSALARHRGNQSSSNEEFVEWLYDQARDFANRNTTNEALEKVEANQPDLWD